MLLFLVGLKILPLLLPLVTDQLLFFFEKIFKTLTGSQHIRVVFILRRVSILRIIIFAILIMVVGELPNIMGLHIFENLLSRKRFFILISQLIVYRTFVSARFYLRKITQIFCDDIVVRAGILLFMQIKVHIVSIYILPRVIQTVSERHHCYNASLSHQEAPGRNPSMHSLQILFADFKISI